MMNKYQWPLNDSSFTFIDRLKICQFFLNPSNRWTQGNVVRKFEAMWAQYVGTKFAVMVSSGSAANVMIADYIRSTVKKSANVVVLPALTWQTSVSVWIKLGFEPHFIDVNLNDFSMDIKELETYLEAHASQVACVFPTAILGLNPDIESFVKICEKYKVPLRFDNCENTLGQYESINGQGATVKKHICSFVTCSTSFYFGHQMTTGGEGGIIFTNSEEEFVYYLLLRNHGMVRMLEPYRELFSRNHIEELTNPNVDPRFDFFILGNNHRSTDVFAYMGMINFEKMESNIQKRQELAAVLYSTLDPKKYRTEGFSNPGITLMACPILLKDTRHVSAAMRVCETEGVETRPLISGNLLRQTCYKEYADYRNFKNAEYLHTHGFYIGLYPGLKKSSVVNMAKKLNSL